MYRVGFCQFRPRFGKPEENLLRVGKLLAGADADLIVLPELPFTGYYFKDRAEAKSLAEDPRRSRIVEALIELCRTRTFHLVTGFAERAGDRCFNSALLLGRRGILHTYRKIHLFNGEKRWFDPGDLPLPVKRVEGIRFTGRSQIVGPRGELIFRGPAAGELVHIEEIDPSRARDKLLIPRNHLLRDRRPRFYPGR